MNLSFAEALGTALDLRDEKIEGFDEYQKAVVLALLEEVEKRRPAAPAASDGEDILVSFGDMRDFTMDVLKKIMAGGIDNNHESMVEEHIRAFNYAVTQGIHPGQALLACIQAIGSLIGFAIRSGMHPHVAAAMTALIIKTTQQAASEVQIVTTN